MCAASAMRTLFHLGTRWTGNREKQNSGQSLSFHYLNNPTPHSASRLYPALVKRSGRVWTSGWVSFQGYRRSSSRYLDRKIARNLWRMMICCRYRSTDGRSRTLWGFWLSCIDRWLMSFFWIGRGISGRSMCFGLVLSGESDPSKGISRL